MRTVEEKLEIVATCETVEKLHQVALHSKFPVGRRLCQPTAAEH